MVRAVEAAYHREALEQVLEVIDGSWPVTAIGHRVVHGGSQFHAPVRIDRGVLEVIRGLDRLAPLHNPMNRLGIEMAMTVWPDLPQVAVFDTAFHQTLPPYAYRYAVPRAWFADYGVRRYGFHGTSHQYVVSEASRFMSRSVASLNLISLHLGSGASATAIRGGLSIDTSMGMTPLEGLVMGTRPGDLDPGILSYLLRHGVSPDQLDAELTQASGLMGLCGNSDMRSVQQSASAGDDDARIAVEMFCYRVKKYVGAYYAVLGRVDALVFTAGIGENDAKTRQSVVEGLEAFGLALDPQKNRSDETVTRAIHADSSATAILVIPAQEELEIARQVASLLNQGP
jgi:acetate kinase